MSNPKIMVVEDDGIIAYGLQKTLERNGFDVIATIASGEEAVQQVSKQKPDLILMDIQLRGKLSGIEAATEINKLHDIPVVYLSAYTSQQFLDDAKTTFPYGYLAKPVQDYDLRATIQTALSKHKMDQRIRESEERYRTITQKAAEIILIVDPESGFIVESNPAFTKLTGYKPDNQDNLKICTFLNLESKKEKEEFCKKLFSNSIQSTEIELIKNDKSILTAELFTSHLKYQNKDMVMLILHDITRRKETENTLRENVERFKGLFENLHDGVILAFQDTIVDANPRMAEIAQVENVSEIIGENIFSFFGQNNKDPFENNNENSKFNNEEVEEATLHLTNKEGQPLVLNVSSSIIQLLNEDFRLSIFRDITQRYLLEKELQSSKSVWEATFDSIANELIILTSNKGIIQQANKAARQHTNLSLIELRGKKLEEILFKSKTFEEILKIKKKNLIPELDGWYEMDNYPIFHQGTQIGHVFLFQDINEQVKMEERLFASQKMASLGSLSAGIAHEMNSPLQIITGSSRSLIEKIRNNQADKNKILSSLERIRESSWRLAKIVHSLLAFAMPTTGEYKRTDINQIVYDTILLMESQIRTSPLIRIETDIREALPEIKCDANKISEAIIHLVKNAKDAIRSGGIIQIKTGYDIERSMVLLQVIDNGIGMSTEVQKNIFNPFYTTKQFGESMGLGLFIVLGIIDSHNGEIQVESELGKGTTINIYLPLYDSE